MNGHLLDPLKTFLAVARTGSQTAAGRLVYRTQPAVWKQIKALEEAVGAPLFERRGRTLGLTAIGRTLAAEAGNLLDRAEAVAQRLRELAGGVAGHLRVGASTIPAHYLLPAVLGRYARRFPQVTFDLTLGNSDRIEAGVQDRDLDLGIMGRAARASTLESVPFYNDRLVLIAARGRNVAYPRLDAETWITREAGSASRDLADRWLDRRGIRPRRRLELPGPEMVKRAVAAGLGVALISEVAVRWEVAAGRLRVISGPDLPLRRMLYLICRRSLYRCRALSELIERFDFLGRAK